MSGSALMLVAAGLLLLGPRAASGQPAGRPSTRRARLWRNVVRSRRTTGHAGSGGAGSGRLAGPVWRRAAAAGLGVAMAVTLGGMAGIAAGVVAGVICDRVLGRLEPAGVRRRTDARSAELPLVLDLLSVCLRAGMPLVSALETVATALPGPFSDDLRVVAGLQRLGAGPAAAWADLAGDESLMPVVRAVSRSAESGSRLAAAFDRLAADRRAALASAGTARARSAGVVAVAPLGLCFLPAFICLGIVPVVLSLATQVLP